MSLTQSSAERRAPTGRWIETWLEYLALALIAFVPQLLSRPGVVVGDTKSYLYLDLSRYLRQSTTVWDPTVGLGTLTHQQIGYIYPMGAFYWVVQLLHIPLWAGQRLWVGALLFAAGTGVLFLSRTIGLDGPGRFVAALAFMLTPYFLQYVGRISALLLPWAGLAWLLALVIRSVRTGGWRYPSLVALVWLTVSGMSASGALYSAVAPALWLPYTVLVAKDHTWREVWRAAWRIGVLVVAVSLWWASALVVEAGYGIDVLNYTESVPVVAQTALASEVLRGLGSWFYYGADGLGQWAETVVGFTRNIWILVASLAVPTAAVAAAVVIRWRHRAFFVLSIVVAMVLAVGAHPYSSPSPVGSVLRLVMTRTSVGLAARSTDRATPTVVLGLAVLLGAGITALTRRARLAGVISAVVAVGVIAAANPPVWNGSTVLERYTEPATPPGYVAAAAKALNAEHTGTRVLAIPQNAFGIGSPYRYGTTTDSIWPGVLTRPFVSGGQVPLGSLAGFDLLFGLDDPIQNQTENSAAIAPLARLMSVGDVLVQNDIQYELYGQPPPRQLSALLTPTPTGLGHPKGFGAPRPSVPSIPRVDEAALATSPDVPWPSPVQVLTVANPRALVRAEPTAGAVVVAGDGQGLNAAAGLGLLDTSAPIMYAGTLDTHPKALASAVAGGATLVVTDTNRKQSFSFKVLGQTGLTLSAGHGAPANPLNIFGKKVSPGSQSTADITGIDSVSALPSTAQNSPVMAIDGLPNTAWATPAGADPHGDWWQVKLENPVTTDHITIAQPSPVDYQHPRWITRAKITFNGKKVIHVNLGPASRTAAGQRISFPTRTFRTVRVTIGRTNLSGASARVVAGSSPVGLAEVGVGGVRADETIAMPTDLLSRVGTASQAHRLVLVMTRERVSPYPPQTDPEAVLARTFTLPTARTFALSGTARMNAQVSDPTIDSLVGRSDTSGQGVVASSSSRLAGDLQDTASAALDGDASTMWTSGFGTPNVDNAWLEVNLPHPTTFDHLDLQVVADGQHSVPTTLRVAACDSLAADSRCPSSGSQVRTVRLPSIADSRRPDATVAAPVSFPAVTGRYVTVTVTGARTEITKNYALRTPIALPLAIAELGIPGVQVPAPPAAIPAPCRSDLLTIDGTPVSLEVTGSTRAALAGQGLAVKTCGADSGGIALGPGRHVLQSADGVTTGFNIDQLMLDSAPGPVPAASAPVLTPTVRVLSSSATSFHLKITGASKPFWLVLGQSENAGWKATVTGTNANLGPSTMIDGFGNGWLVNPAGRTGAAGSGARTLSVTLHWTPQRTVDEALLISGAVTVLCLVLALWPRRRRAARARRGRHAVAGAGAGGGDVLTAAVPDEEADQVESQGPVLVEPFVAERPLSMRSALLVAGATGIGAAAIMPQVSVGVGVALVVLLALVVPWGRGLLAVLVPGLCVVAAGYVVVQQATSHFIAAGWTNHFELSSDVVWAVIALLGADVVVEIVRRQRR